MENVAFGKTSWVESDRRPQYRKRHARRRNRQRDDGQGRVQGHVVADGHRGDRGTCKVLYNSAVDQPALVVDLGRKFNVAGVVIMTSSDTGNNENGRSLRMLVFISIRR